VKDKTLLFSFCTALNSGYQNYLRFAAAASGIRQTLLQKSEKKPLS